MSNDIIKRLRVAIAEHPLSPIHGYAADIDALTDRLDDFEENGAQAVRWAPSSAHWSNELRRLFGPSAREGIESLEAKFRDATSRLDKAERENERLREDAARYRWLRGREDGRYMTVYAFRTDIDEVCLGDELDAAIDAARAAEQSEK